MPLAAREYICLRGIGDPDACSSTFAALRDEMRKTFDSHLATRRVGCFARLFMSAADVEDEGVELDEVLPHSKGRYPVIWTNFTYDPTVVQVDEFKPVEQLFDLQLLGSIEGDGDFY